MKRHANLSRVWMVLFWFACALKLFVMTPPDCLALCATVKIEIKQELTLERQAFDAHMRINNGLSHAPLENIAVSVTFANEAGEPVLASSDPGDTTSLFFIRTDTMDNIENVQGTGTVAPETSADIHWLIIPAPGASNGLESGTLYFVGATLTYTAVGQRETVEVTPDYIFVKPMPQLVLDYFLPTEVYGDDAWSSAVEPPVPFYLGLRIKNKGYGYARALKVESAQPKIVDNDMGLLIGFQIEGSTVNGLSATNSLLADFGNIAPNKSGVARWIMSATLSGRFVDFGAEFSHADEFGGKMTSLIGEDDVRTHFLVHSVMVDSEGRDTIEDFLANDDDIFRVYESDSIETNVTHQSADSTLAPNPGGGYRMTTPPTAGFMYARVPDPTHGGMLVKEAIRSDGKRIKTANVWLSKTRAGSGPWQYFLNIFDHNTPGVYTVSFQSAADVPQAPVIMFIPERTRIEGQQLSFIVEASDPNGTVPVLSAERLPVGAAFMDQGNGSAVFNWVPGVGQAGRYIVRFIATDGVLESSRQAVIRIFSQSDTDGDGMLDNWELEQFGTLDRDGNGDYDGDGISDLEEFINGLDPTEAQSVPSVPEIVAPYYGDHVALLTPDLEIVNSIDPEGDDFSYTFELYADNQYQTLVSAQGDVVPQSGTTTIWTVPVGLSDNAFYYWRVKATDDTGSSDWAYGHFFTDLQNDPPAAPDISFPSDGLMVDSQSPVLEIVNARDIDDDLLTYDFEVYTDSGMGTLAASVSGIAAGTDHRTAWTVDTPLDDEHIYYWRAIALDDRGGRTIGSLVSFHVDTINGAPPAPVIASPLNAAELATGFTTLVVDNAIDPDGNELVYYFEIDTEPTFNTPGRISSGLILPMAQTTQWSVDGLTDNTRYYWRVKSSDSAAESPWSMANFFINASNEAPPIPELKNPGRAAWVNSRTPTMSVHPVKDIDQDSLKYRFEIYTDSELTQPAGYAEVDDPVWQGVSPLQPSTWHHWRVQAVDQHGIPGGWSETSSFYIKENGANQPPHFSFITPGEAIHTNAQGISIRWSDSDPDSNASIALYYDTDDSGENGVLIAGGIAEDPDGTEDYYTWNISGLEGSYYIYAVIADTLSSQTVYCPARVNIDRTPPDVSATPAGGSFTQPVQVSLSADETATIYFTLDGSEPGIDSQHYSAPLTISQPTTILFMAVDSAGNPCAVVNESYAFEAAHITVTASTDKGRALNGIQVYAFTAAGSYAGINMTTDSSGEVHFDPAWFVSGNYKFRIDYLGSQFWSQTVALPNTRSVPVVVPEEAVTVSVNTAAGAAAGVRVYIYSQSGAYLGYYFVTDANGQVVFNLPVGLTFNFRADLYGNQYWSGATTVAAGGTNVAPVNAGGGLMQVEVNKAAAQPMAGIRVYLYSTGGTYLDHYANTDADGRVGFNVPAGGYRVRADYLGYQFWSGDTQMVTDTLVTVAIPHQQIRVSVAARYQQENDPLGGIFVHLFSAAGTNMGIVKQSDDQGHVIFDLPEKAYKVRADYMGRQFWSDGFTWQDVAVPVPMAEAMVTVSGAGYPLPGVRVHLFTEASNYLDRYLYSDANGQCTFRVPEGDYRFRADYQSSQFWSGLVSLTADHLRDVGISTGGGSFTFTILKGASQPLTGAQCHLFNADNCYLGLQGATDANGQVTFNLSNGSYKLRVDHLGYQFWSDEVQVPAVMSHEMTVAHIPVDVMVRMAGESSPNVRVYLYKEDSAYQGSYLQTDTQGRVRFNLPAGVKYLFRADLLGSQYRSGPIEVPQTGPAQATIDAGGGSLQLTVQDGSSNPMVGLTVFLYNASDTYLGQQQTTTSTGAVNFKVPQGIYKLRVDYLGYSHWTDAIQVLQNVQLPLTIGHQPVALTVQTQFQEVDTPLPGVRVFLFTPTGTYMDRYQDTDAAGQAVFSMPARDYMVRADYMGRQYWSSTFNGNSEVITIPMADARVSVTGAGLPKQGVRIYLYSDAGTYLGVQTDTDGQGVAAFHLPAGTYQFRADYQSNQYWSGPQALTADQTNNLVVAVGGGAFILNVRRDAATPIAGVSCYVFNASGSYIGMLGATDDQGQAFFNLADGSFLFRVDYLGYQYWSQLVAVPDVFTAAIDIPHEQVIVTLSGSFSGANDPLGGYPVFLYTPSGSYMGMNFATDVGGQAIFSLPDQEYKIRADYLGGRYWSQPFRFQNTEIQIAQGAVEIHGHNGASDFAGVRVHLFTPAGTYLGRYLVTDTTGRVTFVLPAGGYRFRMDVDGTQHWTGDTQVVADQTARVEIDVQ